MRALPRFAANVGRPFQANVFCWTLVLLLAVPVVGRSQPPKQELAVKARKLLETHCYRCHGRDGANEGGFNYILNRDKLVERRS